MSKKTDETAACGKKEPEEKKCAETESVETAEENSTDAIAQIIAELREEIESLRNELAELKAEPEQKIVAEATVNMIAESNPFISEMRMEGNKKYPLLESEEKVSGYSLLDRA